MEELIKVLVENFNIKELKYEFGKQVITELTLPSLKELLEELPFDETVLIPPRIITDKLIIRRKSYNSYFYLYNDNSSFFRNKKTERIPIRDEESAVKIYIPIKYIKVLGESFVSQRD